MSPYCAPPWRRPALWAVGALAVAITTSAGFAHGDWPRFRGENGSGVAVAGQSPPTQWSETTNLRWSASLPGPGNSSPIVVGHRVIITCWSGENLPGDLKRHVLCFDARTGEQLWQKELAPATEDEPYRGMFTENGYASHTPVSDGERIYAFFGLGGVHAFDMEGNALWQASVGQGTDPTQWGTASSPILYKDLVIITAAKESTAIVALRQDDGKEAWRQEGEALAGCWGTPLLVDAGQGRQDLVIAVPGELWGMNPDNGKLRWYAVGPRSRTVCSSAVAHDGVVYVIGGRDGGSVAVRAGGKGDVTDSHVAWDSNYRGGIGTAIHADGLIYNVNGGVAACIDAASGERVYEKRLESPPAAVPAQTADAEGDRDEVQGFGRAGEFAEPRAFGRGGGMRSQDYSSPVVADGKLYFVRRSGETYVLQLGREFKQLAVNQFSSDDGDFNATPAISDGAIFIRSSNKLYCVAAE